MATSAQTLKSTAEQYTAAGSKAFKDAVEKSMTAMNDLNAHSKSNLEAVVASVAAASKGAEALGAQAMSYSKKSIDDHMAAARSFSTAKSIQEVVELQTAWAKSTLEAYLAEVNKASETVAASLKETLTPLNARVTAAVETFQSAR
ncbi:MAG TPA: TIGR01841 family phasin [Caulobacteraceae bacterium]|jgi:phasin family protein|nr:TIGR01841 family phasin [Caulobacteraceae bacterium]